MFPLPRVAERDATGRARRCLAVLSGLEVLLIFVLSSWGYNKGQRLEFLSNLVSNRSSGCLIHVLMY